MEWPKLDPFELAPDFASCLEEAISELRQSLREGFEEHGDGFVEGGLSRFAFQCARKAREKRASIMGEKSLGEGPNQLSLELATYALLERVYWTMMKRRGLGEVAQF